MCLSKTNPFIGLDDETFDAGALVFKAELSLCANLEAGLAKDLVNQNKLEQSFREEDAKRENDLYEKERANELASIKFEKLLLAKEMEDNNKLLATLRDIRENDGWKQNKKNNTTGTMKLSFATRIKNLFWWLKQEEVLS